MPLSAIQIVLLGEATMPHGFTRCESTCSLRPRYRRRDLSAGMAGLGPLHSMRWLWRQKCKREHARETILCVHSGILSIGFDVRGSCPAIMWDARRGKDWFAYEGSEAPFRSPRKKVQKVVSRACSSPQAERPVRQIHKKTLGEQIMANKL